MSARTKPIVPIRTKIDWLTFKAGGVVQFFPKDLYKILKCLCYPTRAVVKVGTSQGILKLGRLSKLKGLSNDEWKSKLKIFQNASNFRITCDFGELGIYLILKNDELQIQFRGAYFSKDCKSRDGSPYALLQTKIIPNLNTTTTYPFLLMRTDIAKDFVDIDWQEILPVPNNKKYFFAFNAAFVLFGNTKGVETGYKFFSAKRWTLRVYDKLGENNLPKNYNTDKQKYYTELYKNYQQVTRVELSVATVRDNKTATEAFYSGVSEDDFCGQVLTKWSQRHRVRLINPNDKNKNRWKTEPRWLSTFETEKPLLKSPFSEIRSNEITTHSLKGDNEALSKRSASKAVDKGLSEQEYLKQCSEDYRRSSETKSQRDEAKLKTLRWLDEIRNGGNDEATLKGAEEEDPIARKGDGTNL